MRVAIAASLIAVASTVYIASACTSGEPYINGANLKNVEIYLDGEPCGNGRCKADLALTQSGPDNMCAQTGAVHAWPIGNATACHGWSSKDATGMQYLNSAKNITCDGTTMSYSQYPGTISCKGTGHPKNYGLNKCTRGMPPMLYDKALDLSCCKPTSNVASGVVAECPAWETIGNNQAWVYEDPLWKRLLGEENDFELRFRPGCNFTSHSNCRVYFQQTFNFGRVAYTGEGNFTFDKGTCRISIGTWGKHGGEIPANPPVSCQVLNKNVLMCNRNQSGAITPGYEFKSSNYSAALHQ